jgi:cell wall-associated NlpC family hydrolase
LPSGMDPGGIISAPASEGAGYIYQGWRGPFASKAAAERYLRSGGTTPIPQPTGGSGGGNGGTLDKHTISQVTEWVLQQTGHCYAWGGAPGPDFTGCPDCSSFCNFAWGRVGNQAIPGFPAGTYDGSEHGPSTLSWLAWQGDGCGSIPRNDAQAGDLAVWPTHMGYMVNATEMVSAQDPQNGVQLSGVDGFIPGEQLTILRLAVIGPGGISLPVPGIGNQGQIDAVIRQIAKDSVNLVNTRQELYAFNPVWRHR